MEVGFAISRIFVAAVLAASMRVGVESLYEESLVEEEIEPEALRPGRGREVRESETEPRRDFFSGWREGKAGAIQGEKAYSFQESTLKKSTGYSSFVCLSMKHLPFSGSSTKLVRNVKFTCAVRTFELRSTSSPLRRGPRILTQYCGTPAYKTPAKSSGLRFTACLVINPPMLCAITVAPLSCRGTSGAFDGSFSRFSISLRLNSSGLNLQS